MLLVLMSSEIVNGEPSGDYFIGDAQLNNEPMLDQTIEKLVAVAARYPDSSSDFKRWTGVRKVFAR